MSPPDPRLRDAYGAEVSEVLRRIERPAAQLAERFAHDFHLVLSSAAHATRVLERLDPDELDSLQHRQADHLLRLLAPDLDDRTHREFAALAGRAHALVGVDLLWLIEAFSMYQQEVHELLRPLVGQADQRERLMRVLSRRVMLELEGQVASYRRIELETALALSQIDQLALNASNLPDLVRGAMAAIGSLDGDVVVFFARANPRGLLQIEGSFGAAAERYQLAMESGRIPLISIDADDPNGRGPGGRAWRSGQIETSDSWALEPGHGPWQAVGTELGFRSSAAVPLQDPGGRSIALLSIYSGWPGFFSTLRMGSFLAHVQKVLSHAMQQHGHAPVIPLRQQQGYRRLLDERHVRMVYQPIVDLRDGGLCKIEALARLVGDDGEAIAPQRFLPALGADELLELFRIGLQQAGADAARLQRGGLVTSVALNFPAEGLADPRYEQVLFEALGDGGFEPGRLQLEILETQDAGVQDEQREAFMRRVRDAGVLLAQDDLGSGHSSLLRMDRYAFDEVKIDQALVRGALQKPQRALEFMMYLTRLAHAFQTPVTVEGLENLGMLEAAAILGADRGQGYGIARPMPADALPAWLAGHAWHVDVARPRTALGAMAAYLLWDSQLATLAEWPHLVREFASGASLVRGFVESNALGGSELDELLHRSHAEALGGARDPNYQRIRVQVLEQLRHHWVSSL